MTKGKDYDKDGDIDSKDYLAAKDKAIKESMDNAEDPCWKGYEQVGMKMKGGKKVPNCIPTSDHSELQVPDGWNVL
jgi:hypothetical protein